MLLVSVAWGTGLFYLLVRLGGASPVPLAALDGIHIYVGVIGGFFVVAKILRVGFRHRVEGVPNAVPWQRWLSWSMLALYGAVFVTGVLLLLPVRGRPYADLVQLHLLTSVWALPPTTWHVWHYRARATPYLRRWARRLAGRRFWIGLALVALPVPLLLADAPAVSQLPAVMGGASWSPVQALNGDYLDAVAQAPDGTFVAAGDAIYISRDGLIWLHVDVPAYATAPPPSGQAAASNPHAGHEHGQPAPPNPLTSLAVGRSEVFAGSELGLFATTFDGQIRQVAFPGGAVRGVALDPAAQATLWVTSPAGPFLSTDGGKSWSRQAEGLSHPAAVSAVAFLGPDAYASDGTGVFRWVPGSSEWTRTSSTPSVALLSPTPSTHALYASTEGTDLQVLADGRWTDLGLPAPLHLHHGVLHGQPAEVASEDGRLYAAGTPDGVSASADGGWTWTQLGGGLGSVSPNQVIGSRSSLWVATSNGLFRFPLAPGSGATPSWWAIVLALAIGLAIVAVGVGAVDPRRRRRDDG